MLSLSVGAARCASLCNLEVKAEAATVVTGDGGFDFGLDEGHDRLSANRPLFDDEFVEVLILIGLQRKGEGLLLGFVLRGRRAPRYILATAGTDRSGERDQKAMPS